MRFEQLERAQNQRQNASQQFQSSKSSTKKRKGSWDFWHIDIQSPYLHSLGQSTTLKRLSFANSELGDQNLQLLGKGLQGCAQLEILNLSACALSDAVAPLLSSILKANVCRKAQEDWQASLRSSKGINALTMRPKGLTTLDISLNNLSDVSTQIICNILKIGTPLEALSLRGNQLTRISGKLLLDVMEEWETLHFVDLRDNTDNRLMGVLEDRQHLTTFSQRQPLFWTSSPSIRSKKLISRVYRKKSRAENAPKGIKPKTTQKRFNQSAVRKLPMRPQSAPSTRPNHLQKKRYLKPGSVAPCSARKCSNNGDQTDSTLSISEQVKQDMRRPLTCPTRNNYNAEQMRSSPSCSTSSQIAAWEHDDFSTNENNFPFQMSRVDTLLACSSRTYRGNVYDAEMTHQRARKTQQQNANIPTFPNSTATVRTKREKNNLRPLGLARSCNNINTGNDATPKFKPRVIKFAPKKSNRQKSETENLEISYRSEDFQHNSVFEHDKMGNLPSNFHSSSRAGTKTSQCNTFLKEITQALLHLQERLDKLIGPADPNSLAKQATSQLLVLCEE